MFAVGSLLTAGFGGEEEDLPPMPLLPFTSQRTVELGAALKTNDKTLFVSSYPKSGTTWTQYIVYTLATAGKLELDHISNYCPFYEADRTWTSGGQLAEPGASRHASIGWRIFNTHYRWEAMPKDGNARFIYLIRDGRDVIVSFYNHLIHQEVEDGGYEGTLDEFVAEWLDGKIAFGKWTDHLKSWLRAVRTDDRVLLLSYAEMKSDIGKAVKQIVTHCNFDLSDAEVQALLPRFDVAAMKARLAQFNPTSCRWKDKGDGFTFIRKGVVGDHKTALTAKHMAAFEAEVAAAFGTDFPAELAAVLGKE